MGRCLVFCRRAGSEDSSHITQFFDDADAMAVSDYLRYFRDIEHIKALFSPTLFFPHALASDKDQALDLVCNRLIDAQVMEPEDRESIFRREEISSTEINPARCHAALHPRLWRRNQDCSIHHHVCRGLTIHRSAAHFCAAHLEEGRAVQANLHDNLQADAR